MRQYSLQRTHSRRESSSIAPVNIPNSWRSPQSAGGVAGAGGKSKLKGPPFSVSKANGIKADVSEYHEHSEGKVSGTGPDAAAVKCWYQHRNDKKRSIASEAFVTYTVTNPPAHAPNTHLWIFQVVKRRIELYTPLYCGHWDGTFYEMYYVRSDGTVDPDPRIPQWKAGHICPSVGIPKICAMYVRDDSTVSLKKLSGGPGPGGFGSTYVSFGRDESMTDTDGNSRYSASTVTSRSRSNLNNLISGRIPTVQDAQGKAIECENALQWYPDDCLIIPVTTLVPVGDPDPTDPRPLREFMASGGDSVVKGADMASIIDTGHKNVLDVQNGAVRPVLLATTGSALNVVGGATTHEGREEAPAGEVTRGSMR